MAKKKVEPVKKVIANKPVKKSAESITKQEVFKAMTTKPRPIIKK